jgi:NTP pyrophosphatase (non-canonical NTP hydrolase)
MSYQSLEIDVVRWAEARGIIQNSNIQAQARKTLEEAGELLEAAAAIEAIGADPSRSGAYPEAYRDALGDVLVTLIVGAATADVDLTECLAQAYSEIKHRKGRLLADGTFVKEAV